MPRKARIKELVRYIHLNPLRAKLVADYKSLNKFRINIWQGIMIPIGWWVKWLPFKIWNRKS